MGQCIEITCPRCSKVFVGTPDLLKYDVEVHCPFCDLYFKKEASPKIRV